MINELMTHLWQSTAFAIAAGLLTFAFRGNRAKVRFGLWLSASLKFFVPFALLVDLGSQIHWTPAAQQIATQYATPAVAFAVEYVAQPFSTTIAPLPAAPQGTNWMPMVILSLWACGFLTIAAIRLKLWWRVRAALRLSTPMEFPAAVGIRSAPGLLEPGVVGVLKPVLLLPEGIVDQLTSSQLEAVIAHELCHVRRRDNLIAGIHMIAEAVFWFHPLVWWIGARMVEERERACDEDVLNLGNQPRVYADAILNVCKLYAESPLVCVSGVTGSNIRRRIEAIMTNRSSRALNRAKKVLLGAAGMAALAGPVLVGVILSVGHVPAILAQAPVVIPTLTLPAAVSAPAPTLIAQALPGGRGQTTPPASQTAPAATDPAPATQPILRYNDRRLVAMVFDFTNVPADDQAHARAAATKFVQQLNPADLVTVLLASNGPVSVEQDFTDNVSALQSAIAKLSAPYPGAASDPIVAVAARLATIENSCIMLANFPEKKTLMYFSSGITQSGADNQEELRKAVNVCKRSNVAINPIDVRSLAESSLSAFMNKQLDDLQAKVQADSRQYGPNSMQATVDQSLLNELKRKVQSEVGAVPSGGGRSMTPQAQAQMPAGVSQEEYNRRVAYAQANFGSPARNAMGRSYVRYGAPDQTENPTPTTQIWRYKYLDDFQGGAAFEFSGSGPGSGRMIYPPPPTFQGQTASSTQLAPMRNALVAENQTKKKTLPAEALNALPGGHTSVQTFLAAPGDAPAADRRLATLSIPLASLSGPVDIIASARIRNADGSAGQVQGTIRDTTQAVPGEFRTAFNLRPGSYIWDVLVVEANTGRAFGETVTFDAK